MTKIQMVNRIVDVRMFFGVINDCVVVIMRRREEDELAFCDDLLLVYFIMVLVSFFKLILLSCSGFCNNKYDVGFLSFILTP